MTTIYVPVEWGRRAIITREDGIIAIDVDNDAPLIGWLHDLVVAEPQRKMGIGTELLLLAIQTAVDMGCETVMLMAKPIDWLQKWYESQGFKETGNIGEYGYIEMYMNL